MSDEEEALGGAGESSDPTAEHGGSGLTTRQVTALNLLLEGHTQAEVARRIGVVRSTVTEWALRNATFKAAVDAGKVKLATIAEEERVKNAKQEAKSLSNVRRMAAAAAERAMAQILRRVSLPEDDEKHMVIRPFEAVALVDAATRLSGETFGGAEGDPSLASLSLRELAARVQARMAEQFGPLDVVIAPAPDAPQEKLEGVGGPSEKPGGGP